MEEFLKFFLPFALIAGLLSWAVCGWKRTQRTKMAKDRPDQVYSAFTTQFDLELPADQMQSALASANVRIDLSDCIETRDPEARRAGGQESYDQVRSSDDFTALRRTLGVLGEGASICLLIDQSGSMANRMVTLAGQLKAASELFAEAGIKLAIYGFTTVGWHGGQARREWVKAGQPAFPGRLCALMHVVYQEFDQPLSEASWRAMFEPNIFFENVDGEAIHWAVDRLAKRTSDTKLLIVVSDGAPVDDTTLKANGPEILVRHLKKVIGETEDNQELRLGAIGIGYDVGSYYSCSEKAEDPDDFIPRLGTLISRLTARDD